MSPNPHDPTQTPQPTTNPATGGTYHCQHFTLRTRLDPKHGLYISTGYGQFPEEAKAAVIPMTAHGTLHMTKDGITFIADDPSLTL